MVKKTIKDIPEDTQIDEKDLEGTENLYSSESEEYMGAEHWYSFDEIPELKDKKIGDEITITVRVVDKDKNGAVLEIVEIVSSKQSSEIGQLTPDEAQKLDLSSLEQKLPKVE